MKWFAMTGMIAIIFAAVIGSPCAAFDVDKSDKQQVNAAQAVATFREKIPRTETYFDDAYGYAVLPSVTRAGLGFGGAYGKGIVIEGDEVVGTTGFWQFTSGIQGGAKYFSMIIFFRDKEALENYKSGKVQFLGQAGIDVATVGAAGTPAYNDGVAIVTMTRFGLMGEFTISGAKFTFKPADGKASMETEQ